MHSLLRQLGFILSLSYALVLVFTVHDSALAQRKKPQPNARRTNVQPSKRSTPTIKREPELRLEPLPVDPSVEAADVSITARVKARELRFDVVPTPSVEFPGQPARETKWEAERENLPTPVEPGVTYRNIGIRLKITSVFSDIDRIVAEALGEAPITDDAKLAPADTTKKASVTTSPPRPQAASHSPRKQE